MPLTTIYGDGNGTRVIGDTTTTVFPQTLHPNVMAYVAAQTANGYSPSRTRVDALNNLVWGLVANGIWDKCQVIYPFLGGTTLNAQKWNLKDVRDVDAAFRLALVGSGFTYSESGVASTAVASSALNTFFVPSSNLASVDSTHLSAYMTAIPTSNARVIIGSLSNAGANTFQIGRISATQFYSCANAANASFIDGGSTTTGFWSAARTASTTSYFSKNGVRAGSVSSAATAAPNVSTYLFNRNGGEGAANATLAYVSLGAGLSEFETSIYYTLVQAYQTSLGRQVS